MVLPLSLIHIFLDGLDSQSIAVAAPLIAEKLGLARTALGPIFSAALLGAMIGALTFGPLGDRFGRKRCLIAAAVIFGAVSYTHLDVYKRQTASLSRAARQALSRATCPVSASSDTCLLYTSRCV